MRQTHNGEVKFLQGDALEILPSIEEGSLDVIWTDPPYLLSNGGTTCVAGKRTSVNKGKWDASNGLESDLEFHTAWVQECARVLRKGGTIWVSGTVHVYPLIALAMLKANLTILNDIVWEKTNPPPNLGCRCFTHASEIILWASKGKGHTFNYETMKEINGGKQMRSVWRMAAASQREKAYGKHPTQKPVALVERCLIASSSPGDIVLDPFAGSGTTAVAASRLGLRSLNIEQDPEYLDLAYKRLTTVEQSLRLSAV